MKKPLLISFIIVAIVQLAVPVKMIFDKEAVISTGKDYKFRIAPIDPNDPFRGKYITLNFLANEFEVADDGFWKQDDEVYVILGKDAGGYAKIADISKQQPLKENIDYVKAKIQYAYSDRVTIGYPFTRFYMEETKAPDAERIYRDEARASQTAYALVSVKEGDAVIRDVMINEVSIRDLAGGRK